MPQHWNLPDRFGMVKPVYLFTNGEEAELWVNGNGNDVRNAHRTTDFAIEGPGGIVATDNGFEADFISFHSLQRGAFNGLALAIVKAKKGEPGTLTVTARAEGLDIGIVIVTTQE
ncbi:hypothetical protein G6011_05640 [Alternaria panax]|uniref:Glycoside hydrolase family 2 domain-containing protein n=1 Tax=Alternaria panax TaxID=48097 RepID=A0AAD4I936_9PLEO|nr:hypothetical protein G6011_05640 [Alternaria panax]